MAGPIVIAIKGDNADANRALNETATLTSRTGAAFRRMAIPIGIAAAAVGTLAAQSVAAASDLNESVSKNEQVFGRQAKAIERFSARADTALGQSQVSALDALATFGLIGEKAGLGDRETAKFSKTFTTLASDLASFNNTFPEEAIEAIGAAMRGESEPIRKYGVLLDDATLRARALKMGLVETTKDALTPQQKALAASQEILAQTTKAQGDFARTSQGAANQSRVFSAQVENLKAGIGQALLPAFTELVTYGNTKVVPFLADLAEDYAPKIADALSDVPGLLDKISSIDAGDGSEYGEIAENLAKVGPAAKDLLSALPSVNDALSVSSEVVGFAADNVDLLRKALPFLAAGYVAVKGAQAAANAAALLAVPTKFAEIAANRQLAASNRALIASRTELTAATVTGTRAEQVSTATTAASTGKMGAFAGAARLAAGAAGVGLLIDSTTRADGAVAGLESTLGGAAAGFAVGGPIGAAVGGLGGLFLAVSSNMDDAAAAGRDAYRELGKIDPVKEATAAAEDLRSTLDQVTGAYTGATRAAVLKKLTDLDLIDTAAQYGLSAREVVNAALGQQGAMKGLAPVIADVQSQIAGLDQAQADLAKNPQNFDTEGFTADAQAQYVALEKQKKALETNLATLQKLPGRLRQMAGETRAASAATADYAGKLKGLPPEVKTDVRTNGLEPTARAIADLARKYDLTPKQVRTLIEASGADTSATAVQRLIDRINALRDKQVTITTHYRTLGNGPTPNKPLSGPGETPRQAAQAAVTDYLAGITAGFSQGSAGVQASLDTLSQRIEKSLDDSLKSTLKKVDARYDAMAKSMRKRLDGQQLKNALERNAKAREKAENKADRASTKALRDINRATADLRARIIANGAAQDEANRKYTEAADLLRSMRDQAQGYANSIRDAVVASGSLTTMGQGNGFGSVEQLIANRTQAVADAQRFATLITSLVDAGLNASDVQDLINQGVAGGLGTAQALLDGGPQVIAQMNTLSAQLNATGVTLGSTMAQTLYGAGIEAQQGLVNGLQNDVAALLATAQNLGAQLAAGVSQGLAAGSPEVWHVAGKTAKGATKAVKNEWRIASPSRVWRALGENATKSLGIGLDDVYVKRQGIRLADSLTSGFGTPALDAYMTTSTNGSNQVPIQINVQVAPTADKVAIGREIQSSLDAYFNAGGRVRS